MNRLLLHAFSTNGLAGVRAFLDQNDEKISESVMSIRCLADWTPLHQAWTFYRSQRLVEREAETFYDDLILRTVPMGVRPAMLFDCYNQRIAAHRQLIAIVRLDEAWAIMRTFWMQPPMLAIQETEIGPLFDAARARFLEECDLVHSTLSSAMTSTTTISGGFGASRGGGS